MRSPLPDKDCSICTRRRIRCDRSKPGCNKCASRSLECPGYNTLLRWRPPKKYTSSTKTTVSSDASRASRSSTSLGTRCLSSLPCALEHPSARRLLHHYSQVISTRLAWVESSKNPWRQVILPLAIESPSLLSAIMALAAGDLSDRYSHNEAGLVESRNKYRDNALLMSAKHLKSLREMLINPPLNESMNSMLATVIILCFLEIKWPQSGLYRMHLQAAQAMITHWEKNSKDLSHHPDITTVFLIQELFAANALASVTSFDDETDMIESILLGDNFTHDGNAGLVEFLYIIQSVTKLERRQHVETRHGLPSSTVDPEGLLNLLRQARDNAAHCSFNMTTPSPQFRRDLSRVVEMFYHACVIYTHRTVAQTHSTNNTIALSRTHLFSNLRELEDISMFAQDLVWPVFIAGTECNGTAADQECVYTCLQKIMQLDGVIDRPRTLEFLQSFWRRGGAACWMQMAREWVAGGKRFFIM